MKNWFVPVFALYFGLSFATLFFIFLNGTDSSYYLLEEPVWIQILEAFNPLEPNGKVMYGGYFGSIVGILIADFITKQKKLSILLDISSISWSIFLVVYRICCFISGCCYGMPSRIFGISFPRKSDAFYHLEGTDLIVGDTTVPLFPTQLISSAGNLIIFMFLLILFCKNKIRCPYFYFFAQALLYGIGRFTIEFFRIDPREFWGPLSMSQWISLLLIAAGLVFFIKNRKEIAESFRRDVS